MKKVLFVILVSFVLVLSGCSLLGAAETTIALTNMQELESYRMDFTIQLDGDTVVTSYAYVKGGYEQLHIEGIQLDLFIMDDGTYYIDRTNSIPVLTYSEEYSLDEEDYDDFAIFEGVDFEKDGNYWVMTGEQDLFEDVSEIKFLLEDDLVKEMVLVGELEGSEMEVFVLYSQYDEISIDTPGYITEDEFDAFLDNMDDVGVNSIDLFESGGFFINGETIWADCGESFDNECFFEADPALYYNWVDNTYRDDETTYDTYAELHAVYPNSGLTEELISFIELFIEYSALE